MNLKTKQDQLTSLLEATLRIEKSLANLTKNQESLERIVKEICPRGNNKVVIYISLYHDKCLLFMLELY